MGKWSANPTNKEMSESLGVWNQFDPFRTSDAARWEFGGGDEATYKALSEDDRGELKRRLEGGADGEGKYSFMPGVKRPDGSIGYSNSTDGFINSLKSKYSRPAQAGSNGPFILGADQSPAGAASAAPGTGQLNAFQAAAAPGAVTPWGSQSTTLGADGRFTQNTSLSPGLKTANDSLQGRYAQLLGQSLTGDSARQQAIDSAYGQATSRLDPQWDKRQAALQTQLLNQGLDPTSEAGKNAQQEFGLQRNDAYSSAMNGAISQGTAAGDSAFKNNMAAQMTPLQQMALIKALAGQDVDPSQLNALIAQKNQELGLATNTQAANAANTQAMMAALQAGTQAISSFL